MIRLLIAACAALALAAGVSTRLEDRLGAGVLSGYLAGAGLAGLSVLYQSHVLSRHPGRALGASVAGFLVLLVALLAGVLSLRFVEAAAARADWRSFAVAFAAAGALLLPLGMWEAVRGRRQPNAPAGTPVR